jgi:hypothetical protein
MFLPDCFIRNLGPQSSRATRSSWASNRTPDHQQREIDEQLGRFIAAMSRPSRPGRPIGAMNSRPAWSAGLRRAFENYLTASRTRRRSTPIGELSCLRSSCETSATHNRRDAHSLTR